MIERCRGAGIPEPDFDQPAGQFVVAIWRDWLTDAVLRRNRCSIWFGMAVRFEPESVFG
jgi:hypothetical protein